MRDLLSKLDALISETALKDPEDLKAKKQALADLEADPVASKDPEISAAIDQRKIDLEKEAKSKGFTEDTIQVGDEFGISFSEDHEIATTVVDILEDGIVIELDDVAISMLTNEGLTFLEGELVEGVAGPQSCWKGYRKVGTKPGTGKNAGKRVNDCEKIDEYFQFDFPEKKDRGPRDSGYDELERREKSFKKHELAKDGRDYKDAMSPKSKSPLKGKFNIAGPKGKLPEEARLPDIRGLGYDAQSLILKLRRDVEEKRLEPTRQAVLSAASELAGDMDFAPELLVRQVLGKSAAEGLDMNLLKAAQGAMKSVKKDPESERNANKPYGYRDDGDKVPGRPRADDGFNKSRYASNAILDKDIDEAEYQGKEVPLGKKLPGDVKKSKVYVRNPQGRVVKVNFGDKKMRIKKSNPARRKSFRARHNCANPGPRHKARYWSCKSW